MLPDNLSKRLLRLFRFMDRNGDGVVEYETDLLEVAKLIAKRKFPEGSPKYQSLFSLLANTYKLENSRRDLDGDGKVTSDEFLEVHWTLAKRMVDFPSESLAFIAKAAGGFFDILDVDGDGYLSLADVQAYADAYCKGGDWVEVNFSRLLNSEILDIPSTDNLSHPGMNKAQFLELVRQFWFDPDDTLPGSSLFGNPTEVDW